MPSDLHRDPGSSGCRCQYSDFQNLFDTIGSNPNNLVHLIGTFIMWIRTLGIFLLASLVFVLMGSFIGLQLQRKAVRKSVKWKMLEGIPANQLVCLKFSKTNVDDLLNWKHSKEFSYKEEMYDIVYKKETIDSVFYYCWWDHEETALNKKLSALLYVALNQNASGKSTNDKLHVLLQVLFFQTTTKPELNNWSHLSRFYFHTDLLTTVNPGISPPNPPPETLICI